jgi:N-acetylmuramic acid 6-phosphate etherase
VLMGKTYGNLMVDLNATNSKLTERAKRIVCAVTELTKDKAAELLNRCEGEVKTAIVSYRLDLSPEQARSKLRAAEGHLRRALEADAPQANGQP